MKKFLLTLVAVFTLSFAAVPLANTMVMAAPRDNVIKSESEAGAFNGERCMNANDICVSALPRSGTKQNFVQMILNIAIGIIAAISVLFVVIGGVRYVFSQGDPQAVSKAKGTIVYALIGIVVALLAQGIVVLAVKVIS